MFQNMTPLLQVFQSKPYALYFIYFSLAYISIVGNMLCGCNIEVLKLEKLLLVIVIVIVIVIVNSRFLERPQKRSRRNQLIHRPLTKTKSIGSGQDPESQAGRQSDGYGG